jgi:transcriptional regulator with XRE-family HTH domain
MARRKSGATTPEGRFIAARIRAAERRGYTQQQIADAMGLSGPRTVRKLKSGETPGTRIYHRKMDALAKPRSTPNIFRASLIIGEDDGREVIRSVNVKIPSLRNAKGELVAPTPFDALRLPSLEEIAIAEGKAMQRRYSMAAVRVKLDGLRSVARRGPTSKLIEIRGAFAR